MLYQNLIPDMPQYQFTLQWQWYAGNWWMFLQGAAAMEAGAFLEGRHGSFPRARWSPDPGLFKHFGLPAVFGEGSAR